MPKLSRDDVFKARQVNYAHHYEHRQWAKKQDDGTRRYCQNACLVLSKPKLNYFANWDGSYFEGDNWLRLVSACEIMKLSACDLVIWYWSEEGWAEFESLFNELSEPENLSTTVVDKSLGIYPQVVDKSPLIHISTALVEKTMVF